MRLYSLAPAALLLAASTLVAHADTIETFNLSGTGTSPNITVSGTITLDTTNGTVSSNDLSVSEGTSTETLVNDVTFAGATNSSSVYGLEFGTFDSAGGSVFLDFNQSSLVGYAGGNVCSSSSLCSSGETSTAEFGANFGESLQTASLTLSAPPPPPPPSVPEPSTLALLGTGILGLAGMARRKFFPQS